MNMFVNPPEVYLCAEHVDFRKSINGLAALVECELELPVLSGALFVFCNKKRDWFETITYDNNDEQVVLTLKHDGKFESGIASSEFKIVDSSHECSLISKSGTFRSIEGGKAIYQIS